MVPFVRTSLIILAAASALIVPASSNAQQSAAPAANSAAQSASPSPVPAPSAQPLNGSGPATQQDSLAAAARRAREQKAQAQAKTPRVFTNDNIPTQGGVSTVGSEPNPAAESGAAPPDGTANGNPKPILGSLSGNDEKGWRDLFKNLRSKQEQDEAELAIEQRELGVADVQYYSDPVKGMQQGLTRSDINDKTAKIENLKKRIEDDKQAISDAEDQLRKAGGDVGWAR
jgi:hypothetical protein